MGSLCYVERGYCDTHRVRYDRYHYATLALLLKITEELLLNFENPIEPFKPLTSSVVTFHSALQCGTLCSTESYLVQCTREYIAIRRS